MIELRAVTALDIDRFYAWRNDERIWRWCRQYKQITYNAHLEYWHSMDHDPTREFFAIGSPSFPSVGCAGLSSIDLINRRAEFSLYISPIEQGKGYGFLGLKALFDWGFNNLNLNVIWGETFANNPGRNLFKKLGMSEEGTRNSFYFRDGKYIDAVLYSMKAQEWNI